MSKDKKVNKNSEDKIAEKKTSEVLDANKKTLKPEAEKKDELKTKIKTTEITAEKKPDSGLEELPDDIKAKLEKRKIERTKNTSKYKKKKKKEFKKVTTGKAFIKATYNNTIVTLTDLNGNVISWASAGIAGFKGPKKSTPYAAQIITRIAAEKAKKHGLSEVSVFVRGVGTGRESSIRSLNANGIQIKSIKDVTPIPHNGCRARKPRRV